MAAIAMKYGCVSAKAKWKAGDFEPGESYHGAGSGIANENNRQRHGEKRRRVANDVSMAVAACS